MPDDIFLTEPKWKSLLASIHRGNVIPIVGPDLITAVDEATGETRSLQCRLAPRMAADLGLEEPEKFKSFNDVARAFLLTGGDRKELYITLGDILERETPAPSQALLDLAGISDFNLFIASTPDPSLARAVQQARPGFSPARNVIRFHPAGNPNRSVDAPLSGSAESPCDLPGNFKGPLVYHILGDYQTLPDFAVWEEDYMEFVCGLLESRDTLENLFRFIATKDLLILGAPSDDWIVRFFLRAARGKRLSERKNSGYLVDYRTQLGEPMIYFFDKAVQSTRVVDGSPERFTSALAARWHAEYGGGVTDDEFLQRQPDEMPRGSVFLSYSRDDLKVAVRIARALSVAGVPVWLDRQRLNAGENYNTTIEGLVKDGCSFFVSLISRATEDAPDRYVHKERAWAAQKHVDGYVFYLPLIIDDTRLPKLEPACFAPLHRETLDNLGAFATRVRQLVSEFRDSGRPRM